MASSAPEPADRMPVVHEYGQRALPEVSAAAGPSTAAGPSAAAFSKPLPVSPPTTEASPATGHAAPVSPHGQAVQPEAAQRNVANAANVATDPEQQQQAPRVYSEEKTSPVYAWKRRHMLLLAVAFVLSVVGLGLAGRAAATGGFDLAGEASILAIPIPIYVLTIVFAVAETAVRASRKFERGFHPAVHVGVWLICWIVYAGLIAVFAILVRWVAQDGGFRSDRYDDDDEGFASNGQFLAQFVFIILLCLNTFILFIMACIDTQAYNVAQATPPTDSVDPNHHEDRAWRMTKLVFNVLVIVFGLIGFAIGLSMVRFHEGYGGSNIVFPACACALLIPVVWAVADLCFALTGPRRVFFQGIHPGAHVGVWLVAWLLLAIVGGMLTSFAVINVAQCGDYRDRDMRRSVAAADGYALRSVPVVEVAAAVVPNRARQVNGGVTSTTSVVATPTVNPNGNINTLRVTSTSTSIRGSRPTTTTSVFDPYGDDPTDDPYDEYPYSRYRTSTSSSYGSRATNSPYGDYPYDNSPNSGSGSSSSSGSGRSSYYNDPYEQDQRDFCAQKGVDGLMIATCVFMWIVFVFAFVLFVAGCADTYLRNHLRNPFTVVYVPVAQPMGQQPMGQQQQQPYQYQYQYPQQPVYSNAPMMQGGAGGKQVMQQGPVVQQQQQQQHQQQQQTHPAQGNVVEYYGTAQ